METTKVLPFLIPIFLLLATSETVICFDRENACTETSLESSTTVDDVQSISWDTFNHW